MMLRKLIIIAIITSIFSGSIFAGSLSDLDQCFVTPHASTAPTGQKQRAHRITATHRGAAWRDEFPR